LFNGFQESERVKNGKGDGRIEENRREKEE
jgi:hypothetical protein